jgi:hypothetical protein
MIKWVIILLSKIYLFLRYFLFFNSINDQTIEWTHSLSFILILVFISISDFKKTDTLNF